MPANPAPTTRRVSGEARTVRGPFEKLVHPVPGHVRRGGCGVRAASAMWGDLVAEPLQTLAVSPPTIVCAVAPYRSSETVPGHTRCPAGAVRRGGGARNPAEFLDPDAGERKLLATTGFSRPCRRSSERFWISLDAGSAPSIEQPTNCGTILHPAPYHSGRPCR